MHNLIVIIAVRGWSKSSRLDKQLVDDLYPDKDKRTPRNWTLKPIPIFWIKTIHAVYIPEGFSGSWSIASGSKDQGIRYAVEAPNPTKIIINKRINSFIPSILPKANKELILTPLVIGGINITKKQANTHIFPPLNSADILPYLLE